ncbi:hypothetical protein Fmac_020738 [Flemingia macrophylla]|uniref:Uncharacterized protein n=1 Tax=Flemingia macrophylla TaxID=520843 RepID=A0ABD1LUU8_9FABA
MDHMMLKRAFAGRPNPLLVLVTVLVLIMVGFYSMHFPHGAFSSPSHVFISYSSNSTIADYLRALTGHPHVAGTKPASATARYVRDQFSALGLRSETVKHAALLSYPTRASLAAHFSDGGSLEFRLKEEEEEVVAPYHAYSPSGAAFAEAVFVNYGREEDFRALRALGVEVAGCVAVARRGGGVGRAAVVEAAERGGGGGGGGVRGGGGCGERARDESGDWRPVESRVGRGGEVGFGGQ